MTKIKLKHLLKSKRGWKNLATFFSIILIFITFVFFILLFKSIGGNVEANTANAFNSLDSEFALKTFLMSPADVKTENIDLKFGLEATNADLISSTCVEGDGKPLSHLRIKLNEYFEKLYGDEWHVELVYYTPDSDERDNPDEFRLVSFGKDIYLDKSNVIDSVVYKETLKNSGFPNLKTYQYIALFRVDVKQPGLATQSLPCLEDGTVVKVVLINLNAHNLKVRI